MKKILLLMLGAVAALASCQKSDLDGIGMDGMVDVTVAAAMDGASATTRATAGDGTIVDRCILEVYTGGDLYKRMVASVNQTALTASFDLRLVSSQTYEFLLWADKGTNETTTDASGDDVVGGGDKHYTTTNTNGLKEISADYTSYAGNDESRDAFYYAETMEITASTVIKADLTRPFGQVNVKTDLTDVPVGMYPKSVKVEYGTTVGNTFDVSTGKVEGSEKITWLATNIVDAAEVDGSTTRTSLKLTTDYLFASKDEQDVHNFKMYFYDANDDEITTNENFKNIPVQRNYRTNISGDLLTKQGTINVTIKPEFEKSENNVTITEVANATDLDKLMKETTETAKVEASYAVVDPVSGTSNAATITIPDLTGDATSTSNKTSRSIDLKGGIENNTTLTITTASTAAATDPDVVYITVPSTNEESLNINLPNSTVYVNGKIKGGNIKTAQDTFVINEGAEVDGLTIEAGNVKVYGTLKGEVAKSTSNTEVTTITVYKATADITNATIASDITVLYVDPSLPVQNVTSGLSYSATQLQDAIDAAADGDVFELAAGKYVAKDLIISKSITINGAQADINGVKRAASGIDSSIESYIQGRITIGTGAYVTLNGLYFDGYSNYYQTDVASITGSNAIPTIWTAANNIGTLTVTNCIGDEISGSLIYTYSNGSCSKLIFTNNYITGVGESGKIGTTNKTFILAYSVADATITGNYFAAASRGVNFAHTSYSSYVSDTKLNISNNTFDDFSNYAVQTPYYPYGKTVIANNKISNIDSGIDGEEEGAINIRGYQDAGGDGILEYEYEITNNTFTNVASVFLTRLYSKTDDSGLVIGDDKVVISGNTIRNVSKWILRCDDDKDYDGTIDLSDNNISYSGDFADYLYLLGNAKVKYADKEYGYVSPVYNTTTGVGYEDLADAIAAVQEGETITIGKDLALGEALTIDKAITIDGGNYAMTMDAAGQFIVASDVTMNNMNITAATAVDLGPIYVKTADTKFALNSSYITYTTASSCSNWVADYGKNGIIKVNPASEIDNVDIVINDSHLHIGNQKQVVVSFYGTEDSQSGSSVTLNNTKITAAKKSEIPNLTLGGEDCLFKTAGFFIADADGFELNIVNNSSISGVYYAIDADPRYAPTNQIIKVTDSYMEGYSALHTRQQGGTVDVVRSTLKGHCIGDGYGAVVVDASDAEITFDNSTIWSVKYTIYPHDIYYAVYVRNSNNTLNFNGNTKFIDEVEAGIDHGTYMIVLYNDVSDISVVDDGTTIIVDEKGTVLSSASLWSLQQ